ncbi:Hypothetical predicted protein [Mytilus galloprovincialis]|uniref:Uncharacterized protein n=1 Tax=Mytilus galloprovincialis TaxID=29158 RepID=A0A8B6GX68_MYTGA|nr:Hypothetical predicted protein [Mytilus galloprovincialis]
MITNAPIVANQAQPVQTDFRMSRMRALRILGGAHIGLGVICVILGIVGVILSNIEKNNRCQSNNSGYDYLYFYNYRCSDATGIVILYSICMACSGWNKFHNEGVVTVFAILAIFAFIEFIISIVAASHCCCCSQLNIGNQQSVIYIHTVQPGMMHNMPNTRILTENQHEYDQLWNPGMAGYNGQQPAYITINQQQPNHLQGNRMPIQDYHRQQSQPFTMPTQQQNINTQQLVYSPEAAGYTTIHEVNNTI